MPINYILHIAKMTGVAGTEKHLLTLLPGLKQRRLNMRLLILVEPPFPMDAYARQMTALGVPTDQMTIHRDLDLGLFRRLRRYITALNPDAVHTHLIHADMHGVIAARRAGVRAIFSTSHNDDPFRKNWSVRRMQRFLWPRITRAIAISEAIRRHAIEVEGAPPEKIIMIHHGVDIGELSRDNLVRENMRASLGMPPEAFVFGSVCRLTEQKGLTDALRAFSQFAAQATKAHYIIAGDGPLRSALQSQVESGRIADRVRFLGWRNDAADVMAAFDVMVIPSRWEGFGLVAIEAMAAALPVIATGVSALPEIVADGITGRITPAGDISALARAMLDLYENPENARQMGQNGRLRAQQEFNANRMIDRTLAVYQGA